MTNINGIQKMMVGSLDWQKIHEMTGNLDASKVNDEETLFKTMQYYEASNRSDSWSVDAQNLEVEDLIKMWQEFDKEDTSFAQDFDDFDAYLSTYEKKEDPPVEEDIVRPYIPAEVTPEQQERMNEFDKMRATDLHAKLDQEGDYETLLEYVRQREGTSFLYPSDYNADGTVNDKGKAKEADMIAKLAELDKEDNALGDVLNAFLEAYGVEEPKGTAVNGELPDVKSVLTGGATGSTSELTIGDNIYLVTNKGAEGNQLAYEVKDNEKGQKYIEMTGDNWRIQDISGQLQDDLIQVIGQGNELDLGLGDDIAHIIGDTNRALMGDGDDKVYLEGDNNFTDLWRGDDKLFNINSDNTMGIGFTGDDEFYIKGDNVLVSGENNTEVGDGIYEDGIITDYEMENTLEKPDWFPGPDEEEPEKNVVDDDVIIEFDGIKYEVYKKFGVNASDTLTYYKAEDGRTVFESNGWNITVISEMNTTGDAKYADVVIQGDGNSYFGSNAKDSIEVVGNKNAIHGDTSDVNGGDDTVKISSGTGNYVYGESGIDTVITDVEGNFFNKAILDVEHANGVEQDVTPPEKPSAWVTVNEPNESQVSQMETVKAAFGLDAESTVKGLKQNGSFLGMTIDGKAYISEVNDQGQVETITQKSSTGVTAKVDYEYLPNGTKTTLVDYMANSKVVTEADGSKTEAVYEDVKAKNPVLVSSKSYDKDGNLLESSVVDKANNKVSITYDNGDKSEIVYDDVTAANPKMLTRKDFDANGKMVNDWQIDQENNTATNNKADGSKDVAKYTDINRPVTIQTVEKFDAQGNLTATETYKNGKLEMFFPEGNVMSIDDFFAAIETAEGDGKLTADELKDIYNKTNDATLKGILSNFTDGVEMTFAFELAATGSGRASYENGDKTIDKNDKADLAVIAKDGMITSESIKAMQNDAAYAALVGYELENAWNVNGTDNDGIMTKQNPAYAITNNEGKEYDKLTMAFMNQAGGNSINREDLAKLGITTTADFQNAELFNTIREASDMLGELGSKAQMIRRPLLSNRRSYVATAVTPQSLVDKFNSTDNATLKELCKASGAITVGADGKATVANNKNVSAYDLFMKALELLKYPNLQFVDKAALEEATADAEAADDEGVADAGGAQA